MRDTKLRPDRHKHAWMTKAAYTADRRIFLAILFPLALAWGYVIQKTDAVWGSMLFHPGMDIPIILGRFSNLF